MPTILIAAGGTGGHIFPAESLAESLQKNGARVIRITDKRFDHYRIESSKTERIYRIPSASPSGGLMKRVKALVTLAAGIVVAWRVMRKERPDVAIGFGGYPSFPAIIAAKLCGVPTLIHEQNAVLGRANRVLARWVSGIATAYPKVRYVPMNSSVTQTGNPVREAIQALAQEPYIEPKESFHLLITGGSQGATFLSEVVPKALAALNPERKAKLIVTQQCREKDLERVREFYRAEDIQAELACFFTNMPELLKRAHLVIARAGASTIAECTVAGKPAIFIPYPSAMDDHQTANAEETTRAGASLTLAEKHCTPEMLANTLEALFTDSDRLSVMAEKMRALSHPHAAEALQKLTWTWTTKK